MTDRLRLKTSDGKWTIVMPEKGVSYIMRYDEYHKEANNIETALALELGDIREELADAVQEIREKSKEYIQYG